MREVSGLPFGATDCALPMLYALERGLKVDTFVVITDNETWAGVIHPHEALARYRAHMGIDATLVVLATSASKLTIAATPSHPTQASSGPEAGTSLGLHWPLG